MSLEARNQIRVLMHTDINVVKRVRRPEYITYKGYAFCLVFHAYLFFSPISAIPCIQLYSAIF